MIEIQSYMRLFCAALEQIFARRVWFVGLQGSYARGEATESSDIDVVVILDELTAADIAAYRQMLDTLPHRELICGFVSGKQEILSWEPSDLFQFYYDTTPILGSLDALLGLIDDAAIDRAIRIGACNIYHGCAHNMLHARDTDALRGLYKSASFVVQAIAYRQTGRYVRSQTELLCAVEPEERAIVSTFLHLKRGGEVDFDPMSEALLSFAGKWIKKIEKI